MRARFFHVTMVASALSAAAACAASNDETSSPDDPNTVGDGGSSTVEASVDSAVFRDATASDGPSDPTCSPAGWCITELPDPSLEVRDIWPFEKHAFALSSDQYGGFKILEWSQDVSQQSGWKYIDDNTQQDLYPGESGNVWAPNEQEVYFTLSGYTRGGYLYHGKRPTWPATAWTWTRTQFDCANPNTDVPAVWGIGGDVYALACQKIYRLTGDPDADAGVAADGGSSAWTLEYTDDDPTPIVFYGGGGTADDRLFVGSRGAFRPCTFIVRKTAAGYQRIVDGLPSGAFGLTCKEKPGYPMVPGLYAFSSTRPGEVLGTTFDGRLLRVAIDGEGGTSITEANPKPPEARAVWSDSPDEVWLGAGYLLHGTGIWSDGGSYQVSTVALNDGRPVASFSKIRGISNSNLWAVGSRAFHKTTP
jgi:hypothetical protein